MNRVLPLEDGKSAAEHDLYVLLMVAASAAAAQERGGVYLGQDAVAKGILNGHPEYMAIARRLVAHSDPSED